MTALILPLPGLDQGWPTAPDTTQNEPTTDDAISLPRCIDWLLDLRQSTTDPDLRALVADVLSDLNQLDWPCDPELAELVIGALASVQSAFDLRRP